MSATLSKSIVLSSYGLREGFLFSTLDERTRILDPFLFTCRDLAEERCRFVEHADLLYNWTRPIFNSKREDDKVRQHRMHTAVCLLADIAWRGHPDFRAERAVETVLHGNFFGVSHADRAYLAVALNQVYGAPIDQSDVSRVLPLMSIKNIQEARVIGSAIRLAQRLSGGARSALEDSSIDVSKSRITLNVSNAHVDIVNVVVQKRLNNLAQLIGLKPKLILPA